MSLTDSVLLIFTALMLLYAIYDEFGMNLLKGKTLLKVPLKRRNRIDCLIFVGLIAILIYRNVTASGEISTTYLLISLALIAVYISYIRWPKMLFKTQGFFYANTFIEYKRINAMNLSEDGILVIDLEQRRLLIQVTQLDDLERIYHFFVENQ
ncbi:Predicted membrane protein [Serratia plymuthica]|nr:Predicted membrane protein [Serratia plymuthica]VEI19832.1 Predicted membrane protein [Serratia plymuthica]